MGACSGPKAMHIRKATGVLAVHLAASGDTSTSGLQCCETPESTGVNSLLQAFMHARQQRA